jgi:hypothetical protein
MIAAATSSLAEALGRFVRDARVDLALLLEPSGRVLAQHGFTRSMDVMSACTLAAAIHASSAELGRHLGGAPFGPLHHGGTRRQVFLAPLAPGGHTVLLLAVFDGRSSLGVVRHFWMALSRQLDSVHGGIVPPARAADFERELQRNLARLFGRA